MTRLVKTGGHHRLFLLFRYCQAIQSRATLANMDATIQIQLNDDHTLSISGDFTIVSKWEDGVFVVKCEELNLSSYGDTQEEAKTNLKEVVDLFFTDVLERNVLAQALEESGFERVDTKPDRWSTSACSVTKLPFHHTVEHSLHH